MFSFFNLQIDSENPYGSPIKKTILLQLALYFLIFFESKTPSFSFCYLGDRFLEFFISEVLIVENLI